MNKSSSRISKTIYKACNSLAPSIRALVRTQKIFQDVFYGLIENNGHGYGKISIFKMMAVKWDPEPEQLKEPFQHFGPTETIGENEMTSVLSHLVLRSFVMW